MTEQPAIVPPGTWRVLGKADAPEAFIPISKRHQARSGMDHGLTDVAVPDFLNTLRDATVHLDVVHPEALRAPLALWFRATEEQIIREGWTHLLGRPVVSVWNAARAVLAETKRTR